MKLDNNTIVYIDMDGVLCRWNTEASVEDTFEDGYFLRREEETAVKDMILALMRDGYSVSILSAAYEEGTAKADKQQWLIDHGLGEVPATFVPYGQDKNKYVASGNQVLLDDFSRNLHAWEQAGKTGVKFMNGINGNHGSWNGYVITNRMTAEQMAVILKAVAAEAGGAA